MINFIEKARVAREIYEYNKNKPKGAKRLEYPRVDPSEIYEIMTVFDTIMPVYNKEGKVSATETLIKTANTDKLKTINGEIYSGRQVTAAVKYSYYTPRSTLLGSKKVPRLGAFTPLVMYSIKDRLGVEYEDWDKEDDNINLLLGGFMEVFVKEDLPKPIIPIDTLVQMRKEFFVIKNREVPYSNWISKSLTYNTTRYPRTYALMILQGWVANSSVRDEKAMILDPWDWNNVPEPLDVVESVESVKPRESIKPDIDELF